MTASGAVLAMALFAAIDTSAGFGLAPTPISYGLQRWSAATRRIDLSQRAATPGLPSSRRSRLPFLAMSVADDDEHRDSKKGGGGPDNLIKDFVTQRALQTLLVNLGNSHEGPKIQFLENFLHHEGIANYHGYGALRVGWKHYLSTLFKTSPFEVTRTKTQRQGGSPGNPYLKDLVFEYKISIDPAALADTLFTIRSDIAEEWQADLQLISAENAELFRHHKEMMVNQKDEVAQTQHPLMQSGDNDTAMRKANYDLLEKYCTHVATEQVIHELSRSKNEARSHAWLRDYFVIHGEGFTKDDGRNVGRNFLKKLLSAPPVVVVEGADADGEGGDIAMIDPVDMAARICAQRQCVADKWVDALGEVEDDHLAMKRAHMQDCFDMQITGQLNAPDSSS